MERNKKNSVKTDNHPTTEPLSAKDNQYLAKDTTRASHGSFSSILSIIAIFLVIALAALLYFYGRHFIQQQITQYQAPQIQQQTALVSQQTAIATTVKNQDQELTTLQNQLNQQQQLITTQQQKLTQLTGNQTNSWLLTQADFLIKMAGRKLWNEGDITSAITLLKNADASLGQLGDPTVIDVRRQLNDDINSLTAIKQPDLDGMILTLLQLTNQVDSLRLASNDVLATESTHQHQDVSANIKDWRQNITNSFKNFIANFITIRRTDGQTEPLIAPAQDIYLRENIRLRLLIAAQAVPNHQEAIYKQSLQTAATWVRSYFEPNDRYTQSFLTQLDNLINTPIMLDLPNHFSSQVALEQIIQQRQAATPSNQPSQ